MTFLDLPFNTQTIKLVQGSALTLQFNVSQGGTSFDLTGYSALLVAKTAFSATALSWSVTGSIASGTVGQCSFNLDSGQTSSAATLIAELQLTKTGVVLTPLQFYFEIEAAV